MNKCISEQRIITGDDTTLTVLLREDVSVDEKQVLDTRVTNRQKALEARLKEFRSSNTASKEAPKSQSSKQPGSATSYAWLYSGLDAPRLARIDDAEHPPPNESPPNFSDPNFSDAYWQYAPYNIFYWSLTHQHSVIDSHLANFKGTFVGDAFGGNAGLDARSGNRIA